MSLDAIKVADDITGQPLPGETHDVATELIGDKHYQKFIQVDSEGNDLAAGLIPEVYDYIALTYVAAGNGAGEIETVTYKNGGASGTTVATLTLGYDGSDRLSSVTKS